MLSGGALGSLVMGMTAAAFWKRGWPKAPGAAPDLAHTPDLDPKSDLKTASLPSERSAGGGGCLASDRLSFLNLSLGPAPGLADDMDHCVEVIWNWWVEFVCGCVCVRGLADGKLSAAWIVQTFQAQFVTLS